MKIIDISYPIIDHMPVFPGDCDVILEQQKFIEKHYYNAFHLQTGLHAGTHLDIPMHLTSDNTTVDLLDIDHFIGRGVLLDVRGENIITYKPCYDDMVSKGDIVLLWTDFCDLFDNPEKYYQDYPVVDEELGNFFVHRQIKILGMDTPAPDKPPFLIHKKLFSRSINILENATNLSALAAYPKFTVHAVPLKIRAEASLVRAFCLVE